MGGSRTRTRWLPGRDRLGRSLVALTLGWAPAFALALDEAEDRVAEHVAAIRATATTKVERDAHWSALVELRDEWRARLERDGVDALSMDECRAGAHAAFTLGMRYFGTGGDRFVQNLEFGLELSREGGDFARECEIAYYLASFYSDQGRLVPSGVLLDGVLQRAPTGGSFGFLPWCRRERASIDRLHARPVQALARLRSVATELEPDVFREHRMLEPTLFHDLVTLSIELGRPDRAALWLQEQKRVVEELDDPFFRYGAQLNAIWIDYSAQRFQAGIRRADEALSDPDLAPLLRAKFLLNRGLCEGNLRHVETGLRERARASLEAALAHEELTVPERRQALSHRIVLDIEEERFEAARAGLAEGTALLGASSPVGATMQHVTYPAFRAWERLARGAAEDELRASAAELDACWEQLIEFWGRTPVEPGGVGFLHRGQRRLPATMSIEITRRLEGDEAAARCAFELLMDAQAMGTLARRGEIGAVTLEEVRAELLTEDTGLLVFLPTLVRSYVLAIDAERIWIEELPRSIHLSLALRAWTGAVFVRPPAAGDALERACQRAQEAGEKLSGMLFPASVREALGGWQRVSIASGLLGNAMLEGLPIEGLGVLGQERAVDVLPSIPVAVELARRARQRRAQLEDEGYELDLLALAAPTYGARDRERWPIEPIPFGSADAERVERCYEPERARFLLGSAARLEALEEEGHHRVLQLLTHGVQDYAATRPAALVLASPATGSGLWTSDGVESYFATRRSCAPVVILAACGSSRAPMRLGEDGVNHLGGAFLHAGAEVVVLSPADLDLAATRTLLERFHERLARGATPAEALRVARVAVAGDPDHAHPFYWGLVQALGLGHQAP